MADPVQHDLGDGALAVVRFAARLVIDRLGEALEGAVERRRIAAAPTNGRAASDASAGEGAATKESMAMPESK